MNDSRVKGRNSIGLMMLFMVSMIMMCVANTCPEDNLTKSIVTSVYTPLLFFLFGVDYGNNECKKGWRSVFIGIGRDLRTLLIPLILVGIYPFFITIVKAEFDTEKLVYQLQRFGESMLWSSSTGINEHPAIGGLWIITAFIFVKLVYRIIRQIGGKYLCLVFAVLFGAVGIILSNNEIILPLALDTASVGFLFFAFGVCYSDFKSFFNRFGVFILPVGLALWLICLFADSFMDMAVRDYKNPLSVFGSLGACFVLMILFGFFDRLIRVKKSFTGISHFAVSFIMVSYVDKLFKNWWNLENWVGSAFIRFAVVFILSFSFEVMLESFSYHGGGKESLAGEVRLFLEKRPLILQIGFFLLFAVSYARIFFNSTMFYVLLKDWNTINRPYQYAVCGIAGIALLSISLMKDKRKAVLSLVIIFVGLTHWHKSGMMELFVLCLMIVAMDGKKFEHILIISLIIGGIWMFAAYQASMNGYIPYLVYDTGGEYGSHAFGMIYRTDYGAHVLYFVMSYAALRKEKITTFGYMVLVFATWFVWRYTYARMNTFSLILFLVMYGIYLLINAFWKKKIYLPGWTSLSHLIASLGILVAVAIYKGTRIFTGNLDSGSFWARLDLSRQAFEDYPLSLFGNSIVEQGAGGVQNSSTPYFYLDITYIRNVMLYGVLFALVYLLIMTIASVKASNNKNYVLALALLVIAVVSLIEHHASDFSYNVFLLSAFATVSKKNEEKERNRSIFLDSIKERIKKKKRSTSK